MKTEYLCGTAMLLTGSLANHSGVAAPSLPRAIFAGLKKSSAPEPFDQLKPTLRRRAQRLLVNHTRAELRGMMMGLPADSVTRETIEMRIAETRRVQGGRAGTERIEDMRMEDRGSRIVAAPECARPHCSLHACFATFQSR